MKRIMLLAIVLSSTSLVSFGSQDDYSQRKQVPEDVCRELQNLFGQYYPQATYTNKNINGIVFEYQMKTFDRSSSMDPNFKGKRESPLQRGPDKGGILCHISCISGEFESGQLTMPIQKPGSANFIPIWVWDKHDYTETLMGPYSTKRNAHLWAVLYYPPDTCEEFLTAYREIMKNFNSELKAQ